MARNSKLSLRKHEAIRLSRAILFNEHNFEMFFDNSIKVYQENSFLPNEIYNCDETSLMTVTNLTKVIVPTGVK